MRLFRGAFRVFCKYHLSRYLERLARANSFRSSNPCAGSRRSPKTRSIEVVTGSVRPEGTAGSWGPTVEHEAVSGGTHEQRRTGEYLQPLHQFLQFFPSILVK